ncbi:hypothetical protein H6F74_12950 [Trichocoleus sp. FACHB-90]|nr:hypothetical protein [Trichocoleus sp. FACHB-90]MBD1927146.1 hypothetical protein [Trichocoleus sp. FACHB-90]
MTLVSSGICITLPFVAAKIGANKTASSIQVESDLSQGDSFASRMTA